MTEMDRILPPKQLDDRDVLYEPKVMNFPELEAYITNSEESDFIVVMRDIYATINYLVERKGIDPESIFTWMGTLNEGFRGRNSVWRKAYLAFGTDDQIQAALEEVGKEPGESNSG